MTERLYKKICYISFLLLSRYENETASPFGICPNHTLCCFPSVCKMSQHGICRHLAQWETLPFYLHSERHFGPKHVMVCKMLFQSPQSLTVKMPYISNPIVGLCPMRNLLLLKKMWLKRDTTDLLSVLSSPDFYRSPGFSLLQINIYKQRFICLFTSGIKIYFHGTYFSHSEPQGRRERGLRENREHLSLGCSSDQPLHLSQDTRHMGYCIMGLIKLRSLRPHLLFQKYTL